MIPFVIVNLDKPRKLRFGMGASIEYEQITGKKLMAIGDEDITMDMLATLLWAGLKHEDKSLTKDAVIEIVDEHAESIADVVNSITEAINAAYQTRKNA